MEGRVYSTGLRGLVFWVRDLGFKGKHKACTLNTNPQTRNPKHKPPNPNPKKMDPQPHTLNPTHLFVRACGRAAGCVCAALRVFITPYACSRMIFLVPLAFSLEKIQRHAHKTCSTRFAAHAHEHQSHNHDTHYGINTRAHKEVCMPHAGMLACACVHGVCACLFARHSTHVRDAIRLHTGSIRRTAYKSTCARKQHMPAVVIVVSIGQIGSPSATACIRVGGRVRP